MRSIQRASRLALVGLCLGGGVAAASAADWSDWLFGKSAPAALVSPEQMKWTIGQFSQVTRVPREAGSAPNQHPALVNIEGLRQQLGSIRVIVDGKPQALFGSDELAELLEPLRQALSVAHPEDDLQVVSSSRRGLGFLYPELTITARLFVLGDQLNVIVRDARAEGIQQYWGTKQSVEPTWRYASRTVPGSAVLQSVSAANRRADWITIPMGAAAAATTSPMAAQAVAPVPLAAAPTAAVPLAAIAVGAAPAAVAAPVPPPAPVLAPQVPAKPRDAAFVDEQEFRLKTIKRLRDSNLITEDEYQQKRREILQGL